MGQLFGFKFRSAQNGDRSAQNEDHSAQNGLRSAQNGLRSAQNETSTQKVGPYIYLYAFHFSIASTLVPFLLV